MTARRFLSATEDRPTRRTIAEDEGFDPHADDMQPAPRWATQRFGGDGFVREVRALRFVGHLSRCSHPTCRTSLTEDTVTYCPHDLAFCEDCVWEDGCAECDALADGALSDIDSEGPAA